MQNAEVGGQQTKTQNIEAEKKDGKKPENASKNSKAKVGKYRGNLEEII